MAQIAAETLGLEAEAVQVVAPDTDVTPYDMGTLGSRSTFHMGHAVRLAAAEAKTKLAALAAETGVPPDTNLPVAELFRRKYGMQAGTVVGSGSYLPSYAPPDRTWFRPVRGRGCGPTASSRSPGGRSWCPAAEATIGAGDDVLAPDHPGEVEDAVGDDLRGSTTSVAWLTTPGTRTFRGRQGAIPVIARCGSSHRTTGGKEMPWQETPAPPSRNITGSATFRVHGKLAMENWVV